MSVAPMSRRRKEPILGYVPKIDEQKNLVHKGLIQEIVLTIVFDNKVFSFI